MIVVSLNRKIIFFEEKKVLVRFFVVLFYSLLHTVLHCMCKRGYMWHFNVNFDVLYNTSGFLFAYKILTLFPNVFPFLTSYTKIEPEVLIYSVLYLCQFRDIQLVVDGMSEKNLNVITHFPLLKYI